MVYDDELYHYGILGMKWGVRRYQNEDGSYTEAGKKRYGNMSSEEAQADMDKRAKKIDKRAKAAAIALVSAAAVVGIGALAYKNSEVVQGFVKEAREVGVSGVLANYSMGKSFSESGYNPETDNISSESFTKAKETYFNTPGGRSVKKAIDGGAYTDEAASEYMHEQSGSDGTYKKFKDALSKDKKKFSGIAEKVGLKNEEPTEAEKIFIKKAKGEDVSDEEFNDALKEQKRMDYAKKKAKEYKESNSPFKKASDIVNELPVPDSVKNVAKTLATTGAGAAVGAGVKALKDKAQAKKNQKNLESGNIDAVDSKTVQDYNSKQQAKQQYKRSSADTNEKYKQILSDPDSYTSDEIEAALRRASALDRAKNYKG